MQTHRIPAGSTSVIIPVEVWDSSSATGAKLAGLAHDTASLTCYYNRAGASAGTAITLDVHPTQGTWSTRGFIAIDGTNMPGIYELHVPDACLATGAKFCNITLKGAANMVPVDIHIELETVTAEATAAHAAVDALHDFDPTTQEVTPTSASKTGYALAANQDIRNVSGTLPDVQLAASQEHITPYSGTPPTPAEIRAEMESVDGMLITATDNAIAALTELQSVSSGNPALRDLIAALALVVDGMEQTVDGTSSDVTAVHSDLAAAKTVIDNTHTDLGTAASDIAVIGNIVTDLHDTTLPLMEQNLTEAVAAVPPAVWAEHLVHSNEGVGTPASEIVVHLGASIAAIPDEVWDVYMPAHIAADTAGLLLSEAHGFADDAANSTNNIINLITDENDLPILTPLMAMLTDIHDVDLPDVKLNWLYVPEE